MRKTKWEKRTLDSSLNRGHQSLRNPTVIYLDLLCRQLSLLMAFPGCSGQNFGVSWHCLQKYEVCLESIQPRNMKNRDTYWRRYKIQETLYRGQWHLSPLQRRHLGTSHSSPSHCQLPRSIFLNLIKSLKSLPFLRWFEFWEKPEVTGRQIRAIGGLSHPGDLMFCQNFCTRCDAWRGMLSWWSCQSPVAHSCGLLNHPYGFCGGMFKRNTKSDADSLLYLFSHFECNSHTVLMLT